MSTQTIERTGIKEGVGGGTGVGGSQVVLYNDDHNEYGYVVNCLRTVFKHSESMAEKITNEAHTRGRAIAEVEEQEKAQAHAAQLGSMGLKAEVEGF